MTTTHPTKPASSSRRLRLALLLFPLTLATLAAVPAEEEPAPKLPELTPAEVAAGWELLFDGKSLDGWRSYGSEALPEKGWVVADGCMQVQGGVGGGDLMTKGEYSSFDFAFEFKSSPGANSGIMYHVSTKYDAPWMTGPEYQILDDPAWKVAADGDTSTAGLYALYSPKNKVLHPAGEFNSGKIVIDGGRVTHYLNGRSVLEAQLGSEDWNKRVAASKFHEYKGFGAMGTGHLDLQDHGHDVWFKNVKLRDRTKPMPGELQLFNGKDLQGWAAFQHGGGTGTEAFVVEDGLLKTMGKPTGYLYTKAKYESYVLRLEWRFNPETKKAGNGGVLLRLAGEHKVWPQSVEAQLQSENAGDFWNIGEYPMQVVPERTNGRHTDQTHCAERPVGEWNEYEIIVDGTDVTLMVNGEVLNRAWDVLVRPGHIGLQAEGSEMHFRNIRLAPIVR